MALCHAKRCIRPSFAVMNQAKHGIVVNALKQAGDIVGLHANSHAKHLRCAMH
jgi:hypothetical protein